MVRFSSEGWLVMAVGTIIAIAGAYGMPLPVFPGSIIIIGTGIAILTAIYTHKHN